MNALISFVGFPFRANSIFFREAEKRFPATGSFVRKSRLEFESSIRPVSSFERSSDVWKFSKAVNAQLIRKIFSFY